MRILPFFPILCVGVLGGCATECKPSPGYPPPIGHVVLAKLNDPADAPALLQDGREKLAPIPGVLFYQQGPPFDMGRPTVDKDYDAAFIMWFESTETYQRYIDHPAHQEFVKGWRPRLKWLRVHDVQTGALPAR